MSIKTFSKKNLVNKLVLVGLLLTVISSCKKEVPGTPVQPPVDTIPTQQPFDINSIGDTYSNIAAFDKFMFWGSHNVHDPAIIKAGEYYYSYSTDVGYGINVRAGLQVRKSKDLIKWDFVGWVFSGLPSKGAAFIQGRGGTPFNSLWAPYVIKVNNEYRLYYSLSSPTPRLSVIGLATSASPEGPWVEKDLVVTSIDDPTVQTNAIDPTIQITPAGAHYMYYGSAWDGIYVLKINPATGLAIGNGDKGKRIANRGFTNGLYNGNIEGPEIIYNPTLKKYFLFIAYDWLESKYNVRVCKADNPEGPFIDFNGVDANTNVDHGPMILAPYKFAGHGGYQGTSHCAVFSDDAGNYYMGHQARPVIDRFYMNLHIRKIFWTTDGWPVVSPERYAGEPNEAVAKDSLAGVWEQIVLGYRVVPGYANEQTNPDLQISTNVTLDATGTINGNAANTWTYTAPWLELKYSNGFTDKVFVQKGRDWENKKNTIIFSGLNNQGTAVWGKKK